MMESSNSSSMAASLILLLRNLITPLSLSPHKPSFLSLSLSPPHISNPLSLLRWLLFSLFFLLLRSLISFSLSSTTNYKTIDDYVTAGSGTRTTSMVDGAGGDSAIGRALDQLLSLVNDVPVSSRKYDVVRRLAEKLIDENLREESPALREVNCAVLSAAFSRTMAKLEAALLDYESNNGGGSSSCFGLGPGYGLGRAIRSLYRAAGPRGGGGGEGGAVVSAEKMAAELLWLGRKLEESGGLEVAVGKWAWVSSLGWVAVLAEPRVQASLVKLTAFLIKKAKDMGTGKETEERVREHQVQTKLKMLMTWLPLLCQASDRTGAPTLSSSEREEIERAMEEIIDKLEEEENQEKVLSLWLHHFTQCPSSDWPNLHGSYIRWCTTSRKLLLA